jgi:acetyl esterase/lipase
VADRRYGVIERSARLFAIHDGEELRADAYVPDATGPFPAFVLVHGGAFTKGSRASFASWGTFLAAHGFVALSADYRLATPDRTTYPECVWDIKAAIQHLRGSAAELRVDPARVGVLGDSAGGYLAAMIGLTGRMASFDNPYPDPFRSLSAAVDVVVPIAGLYDLVAAWGHDRTLRPPDYRPLEQFLGGPPTVVRDRYVEASPLTYATAENANATHWLIAWGTHDEVVPPAEHSVALAGQLQRAGALVRRMPLVGAPHFWEMETGADEPGSYNAAFANRLLGFLNTWCGW